MQDDLFGDMEFRFQFYVNLIKEQLAKYPKAAIFGAGVWGIRLKQLFADFSWLCFIDNSRRTCELLNLPVYSLVDFYSNHYDGNTIIVVAVESKPARQEIMEQLHSVGVLPENVLDIFQYLRSGYSS